MSEALPSSTELHICNGAITLYAFPQGERSKKYTTGAWQAGSAVTAELVREGLAFQTKPLGEIDLSKIGKLQDAPPCVQKAQGIAVLILRPSKDDVCLFYNTTGAFDACASHISTVNYFATDDSPLDYDFLQKDGTSHHLFIPDGHPEHATLLEITVRSESDSAVGAKK